MCPLAELATIVLEGDKILKCRQPTGHPSLRTSWRQRTSWSNNVGRDRAKGTGTIFFINKEEVANKRMKHLTYAQFICNNCQKKRRDKLKKVSTWWNQDHLLRWCGYTYSRHLISQHLIQPHHINKGGKKHDCRHQGFLPCDTTQEVEIYRTALEFYPRRSQDFILLSPLWLIDFWLLIHPRCLEYLVCLLFLFVF